MAQAPVEPHALVSLQAFPCFLEGRCRERGGEDGRRSWRRFLEDLMLGRHAAVLITVSTTLADVLMLEVSVYEAGGHLGLG